VLAAVMCTLLYQVLRNMHTTGQSATPPERDSSHTTNGQDPIGCIQALCFTGLRYSARSTVH
jgi:hypothetical protein